jgi:hypothetical protein
MIHGMTNAENLPCVMGQPTLAKTGDSANIDGPADVGSEWK